MVFNVSFALVLFNRPMNGAQRETLKRKKRARVHGFMKQLSTARCCCRPIHWEPLDPCGIEIFFFLNKFAFVNLWRNVVGFSGNGTRRFII
jgi:hypothetical protein